MRYNLSICLLAGVLMFSAPLSTYGQELSTQEQTPVSDVISSDASVEIKSFPPSIIQGDSIKLEAKVVGSAEPRPTGIVEFKSGIIDIGKDTVSSDGTASIKLDELDLGQHQIVAVYSGDQTYAKSSSETVTLVVSPQHWTQTLIVALPVVGAVIFAAVFILAFRFIFRLTVRIARLIIRLFAIIIKPVLLVLRRIKFISPPKEQPTTAAVGLALGSVANAMTETEEELDKAFKRQDEGKDDKGRSIDLYTMDQELSFRSLIPQDKKSDSYTREKIPRDYERAKEFFSTEFDNDVNALNLYDDIDSAFVVKTFGESDYHCFLILSKFKKIISSNITRLTVYTSGLLSLYILINILFANSVDVLSLLDDGSNHVISIVQNIVATTTFNLIQPIDLSEGSDARKYINKFTFGLISFVFIYFIIIIIYRMGYRKEQQQNAIRMQAFLKAYLSELANRSEILVNNATLAVTEISKKKKSAGQAQKSEDTPYDPNKNDEESEAATAALYIETLHWTALRVFFIEKFLRNIIFQIKRNYSYAVIFIPLIFLASASIGFTFLNPAYYNYVYAGLYHHSIFYVLVLWLIWSTYNMLKNCMDPIQICVDQSGWRTFRSLSVIDKIKNIMTAYETQLDQWRNRGQMGI